jgi:hypothetical protein
VVTARPSPWVSERITGWEDLLPSDPRLVIFTGISRARAVPALLLVGGAGLALRFWLASHSIGSDDVRVWLDHARLVRDHGVGYALDSEAYNHPPLMGYWAAVASEVSRERLRTFAF